MRRRIKLRLLRFALKENEELYVAFHLAEIIGCTVAELSKRISAREFALWPIYLNEKNRRQEEANKDGS